MTTLATCRTSVVLFTRGNHLPGRSSYFDANRRWWSRYNFVVVWGGGDAAVLLVLCCGVVSWRFVVVERRLLLLLLLLLCCLCVWNLNLLRVLGAEVGVAPCPVATLLSCNRAPPITGQGFLKSAVHHWANIFAALFCFLHRVYFNLVVDTFTINTLWRHFWIEEYPSGNTYQEFNNTILYIPWLHVLKH